MTTANLTALKKRAQPHDCKTDPACHHVPYFEARVETENGTAQRSGTRRLCAVHLGEVVIDLAKWARRHGITGGQVKVLIAMPPPSGQSLTTCGGETPAGFPFASIPLD